MKDKGEREGQNDMGEKQICWKPDYDILWKAFRLAVMTALTFGDFIIYSNDDVTKIMEWFLKQAKGE